MDVISWLLDGGDVLGSDVDEDSTPARAYLEAAAGNVFCVEPGPRAA